MRWRAVGMPARVSRVPALHLGLLTFPPSSFLPDPLFPTFSAFPPRIPIPLPRYSPTSLAGGWSATRK